MDDIWRIGLEIGKFHVVVSVYCHKLMQVHFSNWIYFIFKNEIKSNIFPAFGSHTLHTQKHFLKYYRQNSNSAAYWLFCSCVARTQIDINYYVCTLSFPTRVFEHSWQTHLITSPTPNIIMFDPFIHGACYRWLATDAFHCVANAIVL